jgi:hypothetical protein
MYASLDIIKKYYTITKLDILVAYSRGGECLSDLIARLSYSGDSIITITLLSDINVKNCFERLYQNILDRHLRYINLIFLKTPKHPNGLCLDIYYPHYSLAIEVRGKQHKYYIEHCSSDFRRV